MSKDYDKTIIIGRPNSEFIYSDFCDEYIPFDPQSYDTDCWLCGNAVSHQHIIDATPHTDYFSGNFNIGNAYNTEGNYNRDTDLFFKQDFIKLENVEYIGEGYDIIFHIRKKTSGHKSYERNWDINNWQKIYDRLKGEYSICCIGDKNAGYIDGSEDLRDISSNETVGLMNKSKLIIGPSSGPMHLASLSGLKHLVWSAEFNRNRYEKDWNPLNTECIFYGKESWQPSVDSIEEIIRNEI
jgi:hypothetical protein